MAKYEHPGCDTCKCPRGLCASESADAADLYAQARSLPAYKVAWALNSLQSEIDFSGCSKLHMAESWGARGVDVAYSGLKHLTREDLTRALDAARRGERIAPTQHTRDLLAQAQASAGYGADDGPLTTPDLEGLRRLADASLPKGQVVKKTSLF